MREQGLDLTEHEATLLTPDLIREADLILTMTSSHKDAIREMAPGAIEKTFSLPEFVGEAGDVHDPVGQGVDVYRETAVRLQRLLEASAGKATNFPGKEKVTACRNSGGRPGALEDPDIAAGLRGRMAVRIAIGSDHAGFSLKAELLEQLRNDGFEVDDLGTHSTESCDYPDTAKAGGPRRQ